MGWDNTTEMTALVVDALERIAFGLAGATGTPPRVPRPYEAPVEPASVSLAELPNLFKGDR